MNHIFKKTKYANIKPNMVETEKTPSKLSEANTAPKVPNVPTGTWVKCSVCGEVIYKGDLEVNQQVCVQCKKHFRLDAPARIENITDSDSFVEMFTQLPTKNYLEFKGYVEKIADLKKKTDLDEAVMTGVGKIEGIPVAIGVMDSRFLMGSMGAVVGEKITLLIEHATKEKLPLIIFTASGGARMQEGIMSLMQMAKTSAALAKHHDAGQLYITVLTDPTTGGVTASFAMLGDIILAEPGTLIGFAGPRVIKDTIRQELPDGFQRAEFLLEHGFVDKIVSRDQMKQTLCQLLRFHQ